MRTHGHREGSTTHWGLLGLIGGQTAEGGELGRDSMGKKVFASCPSDKGLISRIYKERKQIYMKKNKNHVKK